MKSLMTLFVDPIELEGPIEQATTKPSLQQFERHSSAVNRLYLCSLCSVF